MIIISHDRHFLNSVCTNMADLDYGELRFSLVIYDEYMNRVNSKLVSAYCLITLRKKHKLMNLNRL